MPPDSLPIYSRILQEPPYGVAGAQVLVDTSFSPSEIAGIKGELATLDDINTRLQRLEQSEVQNVREQQRIANSLSGYRMDSLDFVNFSRQLMLAFPRVQEVSLARAQTAGKYGSGDEVPYSQDLPLVAVRGERDPGFR